VSKLYTQYPRATLWLLQEGSVTIGGDAADAQPTFEAEAGPIYISREPITNEQFEAYQPDYARSANSLGNEDTAVGIRFVDAAGYCEWYADLRGLAFRLPTEIEWEYACRGGKSTRYFFGDDPDNGDPFLWDARNSNGTLRSSEALKANPFGLYGMLGSVWEWTNSPYTPYPISEDDRGTGSEFRVLRGGSYKMDRSEFASFTRRGEATDVRFDDVGFRIVRTL
jgi:formylglycine-generating enzyme required for sulfatase activity